MMRNPVGYVPEPAMGQRILLLVTTRRDAEISQRLLTEVGLRPHSCETLKALEKEIRDGASALLTTEEAIRFSGVDALARVLHLNGDGLDLPVVVLTQGGSGSEFAKSLIATLQNLTILERPAPVNSILSAVQSAVRVSMRQREVSDQMAHILDLQAKLDEALKASDLGTFYCPLPLGKITWNTQCKAHFWLPPDAEIDIDRFYSILHPEDVERTRVAIDDCVAHGRKYDIEYRTISPTGDLRWVRATGHTQKNAAGIPFGFNGTTQDITASKLWEQERERLLSSERAARIEGERANRLKDEFLATLGHELRTPLNAIMGWVELLRLEAENPAMIQEGVEVIERNVRAQAQLIDDLLDVSRIISGKVRLELTPLRLEDVLRSALDTVRPSALEKGVLLGLSIQDTIPVIAGDFGRLQQVVWNLLTNAVKFTPRGGDVRLLAEMEGTTLVVAVSDTGEGIDPDFLPHVFERFRQADGSASRHHSGLGLGLSIVKTLIEMHGGDVIAHSKGKGKGATFEIRLPVGAMNLPTEVPVSQAYSRFDDGQSGRPDLSGLRVLVVDDEPDARTMMHRLLENCDATSVEAANAADALRLLAEQKFDVLLSDIGMPGKDGYQLVQEVRSLGLTLPAVALTAFARSEDKARSLSAGFNAHLAKPIEAGELLSLVATMAGRVSGVA